MSLPKGTLNIIKPYMQRPQAEPSRTEQAADHSGAHGRVFIARDIVSQIVEVRNPTANSATASPAGLPSDETVHEQARRNLTTTITDCDSDDSEDSMSSSESASFTNNHHALPPSYEEATGGRPGQSVLSNNTSTFTSGNSGTEPRGRRLNSSVVSYLDGNGNTVRSTTYFSGNNYGILSGHTNFHNAPAVHGNFPTRATTATRAINATQATTATRPTIATHPTNTNARGRAVNSTVVFGRNNGGLQISGTDVHNDGGTGGDVYTTTIFGDNNGGIQASGVIIIGKNITFGPEGMRIE